MTGRIAIFVALGLSLVFDDFDNLVTRKGKLYWFIVYILSSVYAILDVDNDSCLFNILAMVFMVLGFFAAVKVYLNNPERVQVNEPPREYTCNLYDYLTFSHVNDLINTAMEKKKLLLEDIPFLVDEDSSAIIWNKVQDKFRSTKMKKKIHFILVLFKLIRDEWLVQGCFQLLSSTALYLSPIALQRIVSHVSGDHTLIFCTKSVLNQY